MKKRHGLLGTVVVLSGLLVIMSQLTHTKAQDSFSSDNYSYSSIPAQTALPTSKVSFTGKEWMGTGSNIDITSVGTIHVNSSTIPYADKKTAFQGAKDYNRSGSAYYQLLSGKDSEWDLTVLDNPSAADALSGFEREDYKINKKDGWKTVQLPASWTSYGFDYPIYVNSRMPFQETVEFPKAPVNKNPVGLYRKEFKVKDTFLQNNGKVYLTFAGVESAYYVYINGKQVGYSEDSYNPHSFDITDYLNPKGQDNTLAVKVYKFCDGTWLEGQDMIRDGGIFRDVYLTSTPTVHINDFKVVTDLSNDFSSADLNLDLSVVNDSTAAASGMGAELTLYNEAGTVFAEKSVDVADMESGKSSSGKVTMHVDNPKLWDADHPNLYTLVISLYDKNKKVYYEGVSVNVGFRELSFTSTQVADRTSYKNITTKYDTVKLNGKRLLIKGVDRHDSDIEKRKYVSHEAYEKDVQLMKEYNINAIRTSHYANDDYLYYLCDKYGLYLMCETNNESHAIQNQGAKLTILENAAMSRQYTAFARLKNVTSNLIWSIGNESTTQQSDGSFANGMFGRMICYFKDNDPTRMVHYEGICDSNNNTAGGVDMISHMYYTPSGLKSAAVLESHMPYILCEYDHAMGNAVGSLKDYWDVIRKNDNLMGGFIWSWSDLSRKVALGSKDWDYYATKEAHTSGMYNLAGYYLGYGGDWGDTINDGTFCETGLTSADHNPQPELKEVKYQYQDFWFESNEDKLTTNTIRVKNESMSKDLSEYNVVWELKENGTTIQSGTINEELAAGSEKQITIPYKMPDHIKTGAEYFLNLSVQLKEDTWYAKKGAEIAYKQFAVATDTGKVIHKVDANGLKMTKKEKFYLFTGKDFSFELNITTGAIQNYKYKGKVLIEKGPTPNFDRGKLDTDYLSYTGIKDTLKLYGKPTVSRDTYGRYIVKETIMGTVLQLRKKRNIVIKQTYTIDGNGAITVAAAYDFSDLLRVDLTKVGTIMTLASGNEAINWYGNGDGESYSDRCSYTRVGNYSSTTYQMYYPFEVPQDCGNLTGVRWIKVFDKVAGTGVLIAASDTVNAAALPFTPEELDTAKHVKDLHASGKTYLTVDAAVEGVGNNSCGFKTLEQYQVTGKKYQFEYTILPVVSNSDCMSLSNQYKTGTKIDAEKLITKSDSNK